MKVPFGFFLRLFLSFIAAKLILRALDSESSGWLILLTLIFLINAYVFEYPALGERLRRWKRPTPAAPDEGRQTTSNQTHQAD